MTPTSQAHPEVPIDLEIALYFQNTTTAAAFSELISTLGFTPYTVASREELRSAKKIITEPKFYEDLSTEQQSSCLVIGNQYTSAAMSCPVIRQPLTPQKVQQGLQDFLGTSLER
ncbi:hypothetical protein MRY87_00290 [bacterium]|nr:hypothetical protein [bacterium]